MPLVEDASEKIASRFQNCFMRGGYFNYSSWSFVVITIFNALVALVLLLMSLPLLLLIGLSIKVNDKGPVFYKGLRMGLSKNLFNMYKFRTLPVGAQGILGENLWSPLAMEITPFGKFLRDSRLDELPQLINILRGDMDFVGPRPVRPEVYDNCCKDLKGYDIRFSVRPGLIGYSQLFTPHSTPKRLRSHIDNKFAKRKRVLAWNVILIFFTMFIVLKRTVVKGSAFIWKYIVLRKIFGKFDERRRLDRIHPSDASIFFYSDNGNGNTSEQHFGFALLVNINDTYFKTSSEINITEDSTYTFKLVRSFTKNGKKKRKTAYCKGNIFKKWVRDDGRMDYVIMYAPITDLNRYIIDQYFLDKSIV